MTRWILMVLVTSAMAALLAGCASTQKEDQASRQGSSQQEVDSSQQASPTRASNGKIVFARRIANGTDVYVTDEDGTHETRLTRTEPFEVTPGWSPDGEKIAFARNSTELYVMNADGSGLRRLGGATYEGAALALPVWSPDGQNIAFHTVGTDSEHFYDELYVTKADGAKQTQLTNSANSEHEIRLGSPSWSPTGSKIVFARHTQPVSDPSSTASAAPVEELSGIYLINADGTGLSKLTNTRTQRADPLWSPDGEKIVFYGNGAINIINADGSGRKQLTGGTYDPAQPALSPDGEKIAFINNSGDLEVINADGSGRRRLANAAASDSDPTWSPDSERIAFFCPLAPGASTTDRASSTDLCVINADGTEWMRLVLEVDAAVSSSDSSWGSG
jgi:TolB protein